MVHSSHYYHNIHHIRNHFYHHTHTMPPHTQCHTQMVHSPHCYHNIHHIRRHFYHHTHNTTTHTMPHTNDAFTAHTQMMHSPHYTHTMPPHTQCHTQMVHSPHYYHNIHHIRRHFYHHTHNAYAMINSECDLHIKRRLSINSNESFHLMENKQAAAATRCHIRLLHSCPLFSCVYVRLLSRQ